VLAASQHFLLKYSGVFALLALTGSVCMGVIAADRIVMTPGHRVLAQAVHRAVSFGALAFLVIHIVMEITARHLEESTTQHVHLLDAFIPFLSQYRTFYMAEGTIASDIIVLLVVTGIVRRRFTAGGHAWKWRAIHYSSYAALILGVLHGLLAGRQAIGSFVYWSYGIVIALVALAVLVRILAASLSSREAVRSASAQSDLSRAGGPSMPARAAALGLMGQLAGNAPQTGANWALPGTGAPGLGAAGALTGPMSSAAPWPPAAPFPSADPFPPAPRPIAALPGAGPVPGGPAPDRRGGPGADGRLPRHEPGYVGPPRYEGAPAQRPAGQGRPGPGPRPQPPYGTGPQPAYGTGPQPAYVTGPQPAYGTGPQPGYRTGPQPAAHDRPQPEFGTGPQAAYGVRPQPPGRPPSGRTGPQPVYPPGPPPGRATGPQPGPGTSPIPRAGTGRPPRMGTGPIPRTATGPIPRSGTGPIPRTGTGTGPIPRTGTGPIPRSGTGPQPVYPPQQDGYRPGPPVGPPPGPPPGYGQDPREAAYRRDPRYQQPDPGYGPGYGPGTARPPYETSSPYQAAGSYETSHPYGPGAPYPPVAPYDDEPYESDPYQSGPYQPGPYPPGPRKRYDPDQGYGAPPPQPAAGYPGRYADPPPAGPPGQPRPGRRRRPARANVHEQTGPVPRIPSYGGDERR
jgi:DMSO/TMAO reductase YedYZ heme-binding membrane subunit